MRPVAPGEGEALDREEAAQVGAIGGLAPDLLPLQHAKGKQQRDTLGVGRGGMDPIAPVRDREGGIEARCVEGQVVDREDAALPLEIGEEGAPERTAIKDGDAVSGDLA